MFATSGCDQVLQVITVSLERMANGIGWGHSEICGMI
jgi:hypothetical protein